MHRNFCDFTFCDRKILISKKKSCFPHIPIFIFYLVYAINNFPFIHKRFPVIVGYCFIILFHINKALQNLLSAVVLQFEMWKRYEIFLTVFYFWNSFRQYSVGNIFIKLISLKMKNLMSYLAGLLMYILSLHLLHIARN